MSALRVVRVVVWTVRLVHTLQRDLWNFLPVTTSRALQVVDERISACRRPVVTSLACTFR